MEMICIVGTVITAAIAGTILIVVLNWRRSRANLRAWEQEVYGEDPEDQ